MANRDRLMSATERIPDIYTFEDLRRLCGGAKKVSRPRVEAWARQEGIRYKYDGTGGIWTTREAINAALGLNHENLESITPYSPDDIA